MNVLIAILLLATAAIRAAQVEFHWTHNNASAANTFYLLHSKDITKPVTNWNVIAVIPGLATNHCMDIEPGLHFFTLTASNFWGTSLPSNVASTPEVIKPFELQIRREQD